MGGATTRRRAIATSASTRCRGIVTHVTPRARHALDGGGVTDPRRARGAAGEQAAVALLERLGFEIVERNFRTRYGELDVVAIEDEALVFCEVRTRVGRHAIAFALESVGPGKRMQLRKMASEWFRLSTAPRPPTRATRFDVVAVALAPDGRVQSLEHVRDAF
jgi:putative endonuclease